MINWQSSVWLRVRGTPIQHWTPGLRQVSCTDAFTLAATDKKMIQRQFSTPKLHKLIREKPINNKFLGMSRQACCILGLGNMTSPAELITCSFCDWQQCTAKATMSRTQTQKSNKHPLEKNCCIQHWFLSSLRLTASKSQTDQLLNYQGPHNTNSRMLLFPQLLYQE